MYAREDGRAQSIYSTESGRSKKGGSSAITHHQLLDGAIQSR